MAPIDRRVIEFLRAVDQRLGGDHEIHVISGFRSATYNAWLVRHGSGVSPHSGVGYYPASDFIHLDSGRVRSW
jgi:uncharacterized protein YcbK (DUF882 family)